MENIEGIVVEEPIVNENDENVVAPAAEENPTEPGGGDANGEEGNNSGSGSNNNNNNNNNGNGSNDNSGRPNQGIGIGGPDDIKP